MPLPRPLCTRLPSDLESELEERFFELDWSASRGLREIAREWLAVQRFPTIEFRDTPAGRRAGLRGGPEVWEVAAAAGPSRAMSAAVTLFAATKAAKFEASGTAVKCGSLPDVRDW